MPINPQFKRIALIILGWILIALGIVGLFLPVLQGILFLLVGLVLLSAEYHWARKLLEKVRTRFPGLGDMIGAAHEKAAKVIGHEKKDEMS